MTLITNPTIIRDPELLQYATNPNNNTNNESCHYTWYSATAINSHNYNCRQTQFSVTSIPSPHNLPY